jgi:hypothetical protein
MVCVGNNEESFMALGYVCIHCGWMESTHIFGEQGVRVSDRQYLDKSLPGSKISFKQCGVYAPSELEQDELLRFNEEVLQLSRSMALGKS